MWPYKSDALGVAEGQQAEATAAMAAAGVPTEFTEDGRAVITCESHRKAVCKAMGYFSGRDGYSVPKDERPVDHERMRKFFEGV